MPVLKEKPVLKPKPPCNGCDTCGDCREDGLYLLWYNEKYYCAKCYGGNKKVTEESKACPTCGRANQNWKDRSTRITNENGVKVRVREGEDRLEQYRIWRTSIGKGNLMAVDVDQLEYRNGEPVAILEMTMIEGEKNPPPSYFQGIMDRKQRDKENERLRKLAEKMGCKAYIVCYTPDLEEFHLYRVHPEHTEWKKTDKAGYQRWLEKLQ